MNLEKYQRDMKDRQIEQMWIEDMTTKGGNCAICGFNDDPRIIEKHHVAGKKNSGFTISVCPNCHQTLSMKQEPLKAERGKDDNPPNIILAFVLDGVSNVLQLIAVVLRHWSQKILMGVIL